MPLRFYIFSSSYSGVFLSLGMESFEVKIVLIFVPPHGQAEYVLHVDLQ